MLENHCTRTARPSRVGYSRQMHNTILCTRRLQPPRDDCAIRVQWFSSVYSSLSTFFQLVFKSLFLFRFNPLIQRKQATKSFQLESPFFEGRGGPIALVIFPWGSGPPVPLWISPCPFVLLTPKVSHFENTVDSDQLAS